MDKRIEHAGVEGIRVGRFASQINTTCILYRLGSTVIDTGPPNQWRRVRKFLGERAVSKVVVTHHHEDHSGNLARIHQQLASPVYSPAGSIARLSSGFALRLYQHVMWGRPSPVEPAPLPEALALDDGRSLVAVAAPGHSDDMTCYLEPDRGLLFTGDLYIASKTRYLRRDEDLGQQIESLRRILDLDFTTLFCSHRGVIPDGKAALGKKLAFLEELCERVAHLRAEGLGVREITHRVAGREGLMTLMTGFHFSKRNLVNACFELAAKGRLES